MGLRLLPLVIGPAILLPLAAYAYRRRQVRGAIWYAALLAAIAVWSGFYAAELWSADLRLKTVFLDLKYIGIVALPVAWVGFILDFIARDRDFIKTVTARMAFDTTKVRALWEDNNEKHQRVREDYKAGVIDLAEARRETGRTVRPEDQGVYYNGGSATRDSGDTSNTGDPPKPTETPEESDDD